MAKKNRCALPGCNRRATEHSRYCREHTTALRGVRGDALLGRLCQAMHEIADTPASGADAPSLADQRLIDSELRTLYAVRALYLAWLQEQDGAKSEPPTRLLRAWGESTARVIQLLKARKALEREETDDFEAVMASVLDKVDEILAGAEA